MRLVPTLFASTLGFALLSAAACGGGSRDDGFGEGDAGPPGTSSGTTPPPDSGRGFDDPNDGGPPPFVGDPKTCEQAAQAASYVGCDYWPTVTFNAVAEQFSFAVVVSNPGDTVANVTITGPGGVHEEAVVEPGALGSIELPWVSELKGPPQLPVGVPPLTQSASKTGGAYHLVSTVPVVVYQFNPLQYKIGSTLSYSNDASLLLPSSAMTGTYRVMGLQSMPNTGTYFAVTATQDGTDVEIVLSSTAKIVAGGLVPAKNGGESFTVTMNAGDVIEMQGAAGVTVDPSGSLVRATKPVQVITGAQIMLLPQGSNYGDHVEEAVFPAETLGTHYVVARPKGPRGNLVPHFVRLYGNVDNTVLTYLPSKPEGCPDTLAAGQVASCGDRTNVDFEVSGDHEFAVGEYMLGSTIVDPGNNGKGDPSATFAVTVEQFRDRCVFLAPKDYDLNFVSVTAPEGTTLTLDGADRTSELQPIEGTAWFQARIELSNDGNGVHTLESSNPVGVQVLGYGAQTSYQYPGGLNLGKIAPPPVF